jgi:hypothetical protein
MPDEVKRLITVHKPVMLQEFRSFLKTFNMGIPLKEKREFRQNILDRFRTHMRIALRWHSDTKEKYDAHCEWDTMGVTDAMITSHWQPWVYNRLVVEVFIELESEMSDGRDNNSLEVPIDHMRFYLMWVPRVIRSLNSG